MKNQSRFIFTKPTTFLGRFRKAINPLDIDIAVHKVVLCALLAVVLTSFSDNLDSLGGSLEKNTKYDHSG